MATGLKKLDCNRDENSFFSGEEQGRFNRFDAFRNL